jgi:hypothetical protein
MSLIRELTLTALALACAATLWAAFASPDPAMSGSAAPGVALTPCHVDGIATADYFEPFRLETPAARRRDLTPAA